MRVSSQSRRIGPSKPVPVPAAELWTCTPASAKLSRSARSSGRGSQMAATATPRCTHPPPSRITCAALPPRRSRGCEKTAGGGELVVLVGGGVLGGGCPLPGGGGGFGLFLGGGRGGEGPPPRRFRIHPKKPLQRRLS